jgi:hypothetical protein
MDYTVVLGTRVMELVCVCVCHVVATTESVHPTRDDPIYTNYHQH